MMTSNKILKIFLAKYSASDCIKDYPENKNTDYGSVSSESIDNIEFIYGNRELSAYVDGFHYHWFVDTVGFNDYFVISSEGMED